jgi:ferredoxin-NADP reductase
MPHKLAPLYDRYAEISAEIDDRPADTGDHVGDTARDIAAHHPRRLHLRVAQVIPETASTATFRLVAEDSSALPAFLAGQYVNVFFDGTSRPYAMSSSPAHLDHYDLTVRRVPGGRVSNALLDRVAVGDALVTTGPMGTFHHNPLFHGDDLVFIAGGSGVVPAMSMIREIVDGDLDRRFHLIYGSRSSDDVIFGEALDAIRHPGITVDTVIEESDGLITADRITRLAGPLAGRMVYVCGPQALYPYAVAQLSALGHARRRIRFEANGAPTDPTAQASWPAGVDPQHEVTVTVGDRSFHTTCGRPLLDALEDHGFTPEVGCRSGECSLCRVQVLSGQVHSADEARPRMSDAASGYVHSCVAYPVSDVTLRV